MSLSVHLDRVVPRTVWHDKEVAAAGRQVGDRLSNRERVWSKTGRTAGLLGIPEVRKLNVGRHTPPHSSQ